VGRMLVAHIGLRSPIDAERIQIDRFLPAVRGLPNWPFL
jgi:hypothetical protein